MSSTASRRCIVPKGVGPGGTVGPSARESSIWRATSSGSARPSSSRPSSSRRNAGVSVAPSTMANTSTPSGPSSAQSDSASSRSNAFVAPYTARCDPPAHAAPDVTNTMPPRPRRTMAEAKWWVVPITVTQFRTTMSCHAASGWSRKWQACGSAPALYTKRPTSRSSVSRTSTCAASGRLRSRTTDLVSVATVAAVSASAASRRATSTMLTPRDPSMRATDAPMPSEPPAMTAQGP